MTEGTRPDTPLAAGEVETLLGFLAYQRATLGWKCSGLSDDQLRQPLHPTAMTLAGLLMHLARVEDIWFTECVGQQPTPQRWRDMEWAAEWELALHEPADALWALWLERIEHSKSVVQARLAESADALDRTYSAWDGEGQASLRWVLVHMIEEYARHNGHADLLRESIDGETGE